GATTKPSRPTATSNDTSTTISRDPKTTAAVTVGHYGGTRRSPCRGVKSGHLHHIKPFRHYQIP
ncbi:hypothetical protein ACIRD2_34180, partial [Streptomyces sp. NPDC093595]|uniref:hypothetical protein n=1 Tax=Streptomyces sp. NPDC093595 TaxID=3366045 RepID=UPI00380DA5B8